MQFIIMAYDGNEKNSIERRASFRVEPYVIGKVWEKIEIKPCKVGPMFLK